MDGIRVIYVVKKCILSGNTPSAQASWGPPAARRDFGGHTASARPPVGGLSRGWQVVLGWRRSRAHEVFLLLED